MDRFGRRKSSRFLPHAVWPALVAAAFLVTPVLGGQVPALRPVGQLSVGSVDWVSVDGDRIAFGSGRRVHLARGLVAPVLESTLEMELPAERGLLVDDRLFLRQGAAVNVLDIREPSPALRPGIQLETSAAPAMTRLADYLVAAEDGVGLTIFLLPAPPHPGHEHHSSELTEAVRLALDARFTALAASAGRIYAAVPGKGIAVVKLDPIDAPQVVGYAPVAKTSHGLAANGSRLFSLGPSGLEIYDLSNVVEPRLLGEYPEIDGRAVELAGRTALVARADGGLTTFEDQTRGAVVHTVNVGDIFFNPTLINADVGDSVEWVKPATALSHNVRSCIAGEAQCPSLATEVFFSGLPTTSAFTLMHTFVSAGENPFLCQVHRASMQGNISVSAPPPPEVPDGISGSPVLVGKFNPSGSAIDVFFDTSSCSGAVDHHIVFGGRGDLPATLDGIYTLSGGACSIGTTSPFTWDAPLPPLGDFVWFLVLADDDVSVEGAWGANSANPERTGPGAGGVSGECLMTEKSLANTCGQ
jgi:plastocyanin